MHSYAAQSPITAPGQMEHWLRDLPRDPFALKAIAQQLVAHYRADDLAAFGIAAERVSEINLRYAATMLARLHELDSRPLTGERASCHRIVGCCRDFTVLYLTLLRQAGIPARSRVGFATYFDPGWAVDHVVAEVWDKEEQRWRLVDAELPDDFVARADGAALDTRDLPRDRFLVGGEAWARCRAGQADPERFVVAPDLDVPPTRGWLQLRHNLIQDLVALNKREMLLWDTWGLLGDTLPTAAEQKQLDRLAAVTRRPGVTAAEARALYDSDPALQVPPQVVSFNVLSGEPVVVASGVGGEGERGRVD